MFQTMKTLGSLRAHDELQNTSMLSSSFAASFPNDDAERFNRLAVINDDTN